MKYAFFFSIVALGLVGCASEDMSKQDQDKMKASMSQGGDASKMTEEQKQQMKEYMEKNMGGSAPK